MVWKNQPINTGLNKFISYKDFKYLQYIKEVYLTKSIASTVPVDSLQFDYNNLKEEILVRLRSLKCYLFEVRKVTEPLEDKTS